MGFPNRTSTYAPARMRVRIFPTLEKKISNLGPRRTNLDPMLWGTGGRLAIYFALLHPYMCVGAKSSEILKAENGLPASQHWKLGTLPNPKNDDSVCNQVGVKFSSICNPDGLLSRFVPRQSC